ncbi:hypothetical protein NON20_08595 [Synechocystis sp. B12]|jgi:hypothetical protein|uniref:hypothetical protein n=1 Tax=Synechocystis sp. CACIAM 05 TaxID=1933929 RepID=UPI00138E8286|nr:hypothetical protein [Synechocystis sp. CACIAM 05]QHU99985.1 hypothetical protein BWK47_07505 [Synechocystis sp. CACIAM 05]WLT39523.1 hypothetical protein NON20_08595 [Synechocystis sp. B12]
MQSQHIILETDELGNIKNPPKLPPNKRIESIFLVVEDINKLDSLVNQPHPDLVGQVQIVGNVFDSVPEQDWEILQ